MKLKSIIIPMICTTLIGCGNSSESSQSSFEQDGMSTKEQEFNAFLNEAVENVLRYLIFCLKNIF